MPAVDAQQLRALVSAVHRSDDSRPVIAVRADPEWSGPEVLDGERPVRVRACGSPLAVRAAIADHELHFETEALAILTSCTDGELGPDVLARLAKGRIVSLDPFAAVLGLFRAQVLDPALTRDDRWLIDELIELAPAGGWPNERLVGGVLDADTAWQIWHRERLGLAEVPDTVTDILRLGDLPGMAGRMTALSSDMRSRLGTRWAGGAAPASVLLDVIAAGRGGDLVPLGLVVEVLWALTDDPVLAQQQTAGRIRLEGLLGRDRLDHRAVTAWAAAAKELLSSSGVEQAWTDRAERILDEASVSSLAMFSDHLVRGFDQRLESFARHLTARDVDAAEAARAALARHRLGVRRPRRLAAAAAAVGLVRRSAAASSTPASFAEQVRAYAEDGAWVDEARRALREGETSPVLAAAYAALSAEFDDAQRRADTAFAAALADWSRSEPVAHHDLMPLEHMLEAVVSPIASELPVMVLVCDGMGLAVAHELLRDLAQEGWTPATPADRERWPVGVSMLPSITEVSRTSLLSGTRTEGGQPEERSGFTAHPGLRLASAGQKSPVLFHKAQLVGPNGHALPDDVRETIADPTQRVVGVVVNAIDDHLAKGQQVNLDWNLQSLGPLQWLLDASVEAGRVIVLTADHGHVLHTEGSALRAGGEGGGERWRTQVPAAQADEVDVSGPRIGKGGRVVLAVDERIHYAGHKHGYHGGASLQEVLVPVVALARILPDGWVRRPLTPPTWWSGLADTDEAPRPDPAPIVKQSRSHVGGQGSLFSDDRPAQTHSWVDALLASAAWTSQQERVRLPRPIAPERIRGYLMAIHSNGGAIELAALAARVGEPADQLRMALTLVQRLLNVDGSEILAVRANSTVELNVELLKVQFEVEVP